MRFKVFVLMHDRTSEAGYQPKGGRCAGSPIVASYPPAGAPRHFALRATLRMAQKKNLDCRGWVGALTAEVNRVSKIVAPFPPNRKVPLSARGDLAFVFLVFLLCVNNFRL